MCKKVFFVNDVWTFLLIASFVRCTEELTWKDPVSGNTVHISADPKGSLLHWSLETPEMWMCLCCAPVCECCYIRPLGHRSLSWWMTLLMERSANSCDTKDLVWLANDWGRERLCHRGEMNSCALRWCVSGSSFCFLVQHANLTDFFYTVSQWQLYSADILPVRQNGFGF